MEHAFDQTRSIFFSLFPSFTRSSLRPDNRSKKLASHFSACLLVSRCVSRGLYSTKRSARSNASGFRRTHSIRWTPRKIMGLPDDQFIQLLRAAWDRWGSQIADGDAAYADHPEAQRGALFYRNLAMLMFFRYTGSRRSDVVQITLQDMDRAKSVIHLTTKGHKGTAERRLPVLLFPWVSDVIWMYLTRFRPIVHDAPRADPHFLFLSHPA